MYKTKAILEDENRKLKEQLGDTEDELAGIAHELILARRELQDIKDNWLVRLFRIK